MTENQPEMPNPTTGPLTPTDGLTPDAQPGSAPTPPAASQQSPPPFPTAGNQGNGQPPAAMSLGLPEGVVLAPVGRRVGAYFLSILLAIVTLGIGYLIWGAIAWSKGTSPALQVLGMKAWKPQERQVAGWGTMALRNIVGGIVQGILSVITMIVSFVMFLSDDLNRSIPDRIGSTVIIYDPNKVLN